MANAISFRYISTLMPYVLIAYLYFYMVMLQESVSRLTTTQKNVGMDSVHKQLLASDLGGGRIIGNLKEKDRIMEMKLNAFLGYDSDPFYWTHSPAQCNNWTKLKEYCSDCGIIPFCLDDFPYNDCIIYDFGIREQPDFGVILSKPPFNCQVYAFDPSPITKKWYADDATELKENKNYHLMHYGGGGADEEITLREYNWGQVSIYSYPTYVVANPRNCTSAHCRFQKFPPQKLHRLPVRSVGSLMKELGHARVDILKLDVEGSEYRMLEGLIETEACRNIHQITLEWHHYDYDRRYGYSSIPHLNLYYKLLKEKCGLSQFYLHDINGWPSNEELYIDMQIRLMYNLASFMRVKD